MKHLLMKLLSHGKVMQKTTTKIVSLQILTETQLITFLKDTMYTKLKPQTDLVKEKESQHTTLLMVLKKL